jgi:hypothetical protein
VGHLSSLLASLTDAQQQSALKNEALSNYEHTRKLLQAELIEAQQTIARQQERERSIIYEVSEIHKKAAVGNNGSLDRADTALNRIILLSSNLLAPK